MRLLVRVSYLLLSRYSQMNGGNVTNLFRSLFRGKSEEAKRYSLNDYLNYLTSPDRIYPSSYSSRYDSQESSSNSFEQYVNGIYKQSGVVFATIEARRSTFSQIRFQWQRLLGKEAGSLIGTTDLSILEVPWPNGSTAQLLSRMEQDVSLEGNAYVVREGDRLRRLQPDWVQIVLSAPPSQATQSDVVGYKYTPGGINSGSEPEFFTVAEVAHWAPTPDPMSQYRGQSWLQSILTEIQADQSASQHKLSFFRNGATLQTVISPKEALTLEQFNEFMEITDRSHVGTANAYKPLYLGFGADVKVVGADIQQIDFQATQGRDETRIALAGRVPPVILGISEGLQGSSLNAGNFNAARRNFVEGFLWSHWGSVCTALQSIMSVPSNTRLWFDATDVPLLREDQMDLAKIRQINAISLRQLLDAGYEPDSAVDYMASGDITKLRGQHTGLFSVQLQPPGAGNPADSRTGQSPARAIRVPLEAAPELLSRGWTQVIDSYEVRELESGGDDG